MEILKFTKMQGAGNNFVVFQDMEDNHKDLSILAKKLCDRNFGVGGDGILVIRKSDIADIEMIIINSDGSYASMCGNGIRCFCKYVYENNIVRKSSFTVETGDGIKNCDLIIDDGIVKAVKINMGKGSFNPKSIPALAEEEIIEKSICVNGKTYNITSILLGVPHTVILTGDGEFDVKEGARIERHELFPLGTNVNFCRIVNKNKIIVNTWERGAGPTLACGTGCCSSVVVCNKLNLVERSVKVIAPGGVLNIEITQDGVMMTGPAENVFKGEIEI